MAKSYLILLIFVLVVPPVWGAEEAPFPIPAKSRKESETEDLGAKTRRKASRQVFFLGLGPAYLGRLNSTGTGFALNGAYGWDLNEAILKLMADANFNSSAIWAGMGVGIQAFLWQGEYAPYAGADFGVTYSRAESTPLVPRSVTGFSVGAEVGVQLFRSANVQFDGGIRYRILLKENAFGFPSVFSFKIGLWF